MQLINLKSLLCVVLLSAPTGFAEAAEKRGDVDWRVRQVSANFSNKNEAAPIHFRQLQNLYPSRKLDSASGTSLPTAEKLLSIDRVSYRFDGQERRLRDYIEQRRVTGFLVLNNGEIAHESHYYGSNPHSRSILFSSTKSIVSLLVGIAVDRGMIKSVEDPIVDYLPELAGSAFDGASIKNVLQMTTSLYIEGADTGAGGEGRDIRAASAKSLAYGKGDLRGQPRTALRRPDRGHGETWEYLNTNTQALTVLIERVSGQKVSEFAEQYLWKKIGSEQPAYWLIDRNNEQEAIELGFGGFIAGLHDLGRLGMMVASEGQWAGEQVLSPEWIRASTTADNPAVRNLPSHTMMDYGYQWWIPQGDRGNLWRSVLVVSLSMPIQNTAWSLSKPVRIRNTNPRARKKRSHSIAPWSKH
ncbi:serine hydrolase domain-containing protein [Microbulbifer taiwanensis]|uniref:serine hydrolase domain-containing protein n=1 Tax=Microbulbifer taiwanensis TaxID=986746 RepID=UPI00360C50CF